MPDAESDRRQGRRAALAGTVAAAAATVTAIAAVAIAYWDNVQTRRHNRLTVLPYVVIERIQQDSSGYNRGSVTVSNEGVGPAILHGLEIGMRTAAGRDTAVRYWGEAARIIADHGLEIRGWMDVDSGRALGVQRSVALLHFEAAGDSANPRVQRFLDGLRIRLRYSSVYGEQKEATLGEWPEP